MVVTIVKESNKNVFTFPNNTNMPGRFGLSWLIQGTSPLATQSASCCAQMVALPTAAPALSPLALAINFAATNLPNASPASKSLRTLAPAINLALLCSSAF